MTNWAQIERHRLCDLLEQVGPDAPTLCGTWCTRDLAAHLIVRERRADAAPGLVVPCATLRRHTESVQRQLASSSRDWATLIDTIRDGPPPWSVMRLGALDAATNTVEFFVHHEDVRRGDDNAPSGPRVLEAELQQALTGALRRFSSLLRRSPLPLELRLPDDTVVLRHNGPGTGRLRALRRLRSPAGPDDPPPAADPVVVRGEPGELVLFAFGRQRAADVVLSGPDAAVEAVRRTGFGI